MSAGGVGCNTRALLAQLCTHSPFEALATAIATRPCWVARALQTFPPKISTRSAQAKGCCSLSATALLHPPAPYVAVHDLCLTMDYGECFGLLGPNGSGKTTTIKCVRARWRGHG